MNFLARLFKPRRDLVRAGIRSRSFDVAFLYRMGAGVPGSVTRTHPVSIEPCLVEAAAPPTAYGQPVLADGSAGTGSNGVRPLTTTDTAVTVIWGLTVRPYPLQAATGDGNYGQANFGAGAPPSNQVVDVLRSGYILGQLNTGAGSPKKGDPVFVWVAASSAGHVQGQFETAASGGNTCALDANRYQFNGPADANGVVELEINV